MFVGLTSTPAPLTTRPDVYNKVDGVSLEQMDKLARQEHTVVISCELDLKLIVSVRRL
jgi:ribosome-interacting GTPase 1